MVLNRSDPICALINKILHTVYCNEFFCNQGVIRERITPCTYHAEITLKTSMIIIHITTLKNNK